MPGNNKSEIDFSKGADFWRDNIGVNVIPADTRNKRPLVGWERWQSEPIPKALHEEWKATGKFDKGLAVIPGKVWHRADRQEYYLCAIDIDNQKGIHELCSRNGKSITLSDFAQKTLVEQHNDRPNKAHVYVYSRHPYTKKGSDIVSKELAPRLAANEVPAFEVKGNGDHGIMFCSPSFHKNGSQYEIIGTEEPALIDELEQDIDDICRKYSLSYLEKGEGYSKGLAPIGDLFKLGFHVSEGHNRHEHFCERWNH